MATDFEKLNNALVTAAARGAPYSGINDGFQSEVAGNRWKESIPPLWSSMLNSYWTQYAAAYLVDRNKGGLPDPAVVAPGGLTQAVKDLYAPVKDSAGNLVAKTEAAVSAKLQQIKDAADAQLKQVGAKIAEGAQAKTQEWIWGLGGVALGMLLLWMLAKESGAFGEQKQPMRRLPRDNRRRREQLALEAGVDDEDEFIERMHQAAERGKRRERRKSKDPAEMSAAAINKELDKLEKKSSVLTDEFIAAGRGNERMQEILKMNDPLALRQREITDRQYALRHEVERRAGPGTRRLPRGFGPMKPFGEEEPEAAE